MFLLYLFGIVVGMLIPIQTSINSRLSQFTRSSFYASTISFAVGTLFLVILNIIMTPAIFSSDFYAHQTFNYTWFLGGLLGVCFLTGNLLLLPRLGAALTVVMTVAGQIIMGVLIDTFGWFGASTHTFSILKGVGVIILFLGILLMNYIPKTKLTNSQNKAFIMWIIVGFIFGFAPPIQTTVNSALATSTHSSIFASLVSFTIGTIALFILTLAFHRTLKIESHIQTLGQLKPIYFIGGLLGMAFVTANIILMPFLGAALTTIVGMLGQMLMGVIIDQFGLLGSPKNKITFRKCCGLLCITIGIILLRLF
ncbi:DMT family transporter [Staphylococcus simiae]|uniref:DMT family transporter n=1 Tax=Staphylococcus simiae TaxID=308354 RepID=UPI001A9701BC|nr:DMT family transporter [Staphylococcus simiae]MBO1199925.1 DMT family transporter [Staphylococcus simiae]MBO1201609.1 DMT family transporter [Staphylococcus simiae]MBO1203730.1 DMT family transporter [Staphylococcus simiae]MBO1212020.1 DMT family transporter [Staphylococcus simiae]MBO1230008.1 DMT family transporter [Staphylococcus simiae]